MSKKLNILLLFPDQHRFDWWGKSQNMGLSTPHLDRLAARGTTFTHCYTPSPLCSPARACLALGQDYSNCGVPDNSINTDPTRRNYYQMLLDEGYQVGGVGKFDLDKPDLNWGLDGQRCFQKYGFTHGCNNEGKGDAISSYHRFNGPRGPYMQMLEERGLAQQHTDMYQHGGKHRGLCFAEISPLPEDAYCDNWIRDNALFTLRSFDRKRPWHLAINWTGPHDPYDVLPHMHERWSEAQLPPAHQLGDQDPEDAMRKRRYYAAMIENIDKHIGDIFDWLTETEQWDNTLIVYSSDHGEMLGDHGRWGKSHWREPSVHIPLIISGPGIPAGQTSSALVSLHDLTATFCDAAQVQKRPKMDSISLWPLLQGEATQHRDHVLTGLTGWRAVITPQYKIVIDRHKGEELVFDRKLDPLEDSPLPSSEAQGLVEWARTILEG